MHENRRQHVRLGLFVLAALAILIAGSLWIAGSAFFGGPRPTYDVLLENSAGIQAGDRVRVAGVAVGRVRRTELRPGDEWPVLLRVAIRPGVVLHHDSSASIATAGLLGAGFLQIDPGSAGEPVLEPGGRIHGHTPMGLEMALARADEMAGKIGGLIDRASVALDELLPRIVAIADRAGRLTSEENTRNVEQLFLGLRETLDRTQPDLIAMVKNFRGVSEEFGESVENLPELSARLEAILAGIEGALGPDGERLAAVLDSAQRTLRTADSSMGVIGDNREELSIALADLAESLANLKSFTRQIKEQPYSLVRIRHPKDRKPGDGVVEDDR